MFDFHGYESEEVQCIYFLEIMNCENLLFLIK